MSQKIKGYQVYQQLGLIKGFLIDLPKLGVNIKHFVYYKEDKYSFLYFVPAEYFREGKKLFVNFLKDQSIIRKSLKDIFDYSDKLRCVVKFYNHLNFTFFQKCYSINIINNSKIYLCTSLKLINY